MIDWLVGLMPENLSEVHSFVHDTILTVTTIATMTMPKMSIATTVETTATISYLYLYAKPNMH